MAKSKKEIEQWKEYRISLLEEKGKSDDDFEKYITFIASGGLGLTLTFVDNISPLKESICVWIIILGWFSLGTTLFVNLLSHYISSSNNTKAIQDIDDNLSYEDIVDNIDKRNLVVSKLNLSSIIALGFGILCILIFTTINAYYG